MATLPVEVVLLADSKIDDISAAINLANLEKNEVCFSFAPDNLLSSMKLNDYTQVKASEFMDTVERVREEARGYHPFLIVIMNAQIDGANYGNLFGSHRGKNGIAIVTSSLVEDIIVPSNRMAAYFIYYLARYTLSFLSSTHRNHDDSRGCVFDRKINKCDIKKACEIVRFAMTAGEC